jgi:hypothetical protein
MPALIRLGLGSYNQFDRIYLRTENRSLHADRHFKYTADNGGNVNASE